MHVTVPTPRYTTRQYKSTDQRLCVIRLAFRCCLSLLPCCLLLKVYILDLLIRFGILNFTLVHCILVILVLNDQSMSELHPEGVHPHHWCRCLQQKLRGHPASRMLPPINQSLSRLAPVMVFFPESFLRKCRIRSLEVHAHQ